MKTSNKFLENLSKADGIDSIEIDGIPSGLCFYRVPIGYFFAFKDFDVDSFKTGNLCYSRSKDKMKEIWDSLLDDPKPGKENEEKSEK